MERLLAEAKERGSKERDAMHHAGACHPGDEPNEWQEDQGRVVEDRASTV